MESEHDYDDIDFSQPLSSEPPQKPLRARPASSLLPPPPPVTPRYVQRNKTSTSDLNSSKPAPPAVKPRKPVPPPKPRTYEAIDEDDRSHTVVHSPTRVSTPSHLSQSIDVPSLPPKPPATKESPNHLNKAPTKAASIDNSNCASNSPLVRRGEVYRAIGQLPGKQMTLSEFVRDHSRELPLRVRVDEGFCGTDERFVISTGDVYNLHFLKTIKVVSITDVGGTHFSVPLNSAVSFGLLYNPSNNFKESVDGYVFEDVTQLTTAKIYPKLIMSTTSCPCTDPKNSVDKDELLLIKKMGRTALKRRPYIKVLNLRTKQEKTLYDHCQGNFTTSPAALQLFLPELLEHFGDSLPIQAMLYMTMDTVQSEDFPVDLTTQMVTVTHTSIETSIVATSYWGEDETDLTEEDFTPIAIPIELEIEITLLMDQSEDEDLYANTRDLISGFDPTKIKDMKESGDGDQPSAQSRLYKNVRKGHEASGTLIEKPSRMYDVVGPSPILHRQPQPAMSNAPPALPKAREGRKTSQSTSVEADDRPDSALHNSDYLDNWVDRRRQDSLVRALSPTSVKQVVSPSVASPDPPSTVTTAPPSIVTTVDQRVSEVQSNTRALKCLIDAMQDNTGRVTAGLKGELTRLGRLVDNLSRNYERLDREVHQLRQQQSQGSAGSGIEGAVPVFARPVDEQLPVPPTRRASLAVKKTADPEAMARNVEELMSMDCSEILQLLDAMNMTRYKAVFEEEGVDGEILAECDEEVLQAELQVTSKIHRSKLMGVIKGHQSAVYIVTNSDYY